MKNSDNLTIFHGSQHFELPCAGSIEESLFRLNQEVYSLTQFLFTPKLHYYATGLVGKISPDRIEISRSIPAFDLFWKPIFIGCLETRDYSTILIGEFKYTSLLRSFLLFHSAAVIVMVIGGIILDGIQNPAINWRIQSLNIAGALAIIIIPWGVFASMASYRRRDIPIITARLQTILNPPE